MRRAFTQSLDCTIYGHKSEDSMSTSEAETSWWSRHIWKACRKHVKEGEREHDSEESVQCKRMVLSEDIQRICAKLYGHDKAPVILMWEIGTREEDNVIMIA